QNPPIGRLRRRLLAGVTERDVRRTALGYNVALLIGALLPVAAIDWDRQSINNLAALANRLQRAFAVVFETNLAEIRAVLTIATGSTVTTNDNAERLRATVRHSCNEISVAIDEQILNACAVLTGIAFRALRTRLTFFARRAVLAVFWRREFRHFFLHAKFDHRLQFFGVEQHARDITRIDLRIFASRPRFAGIALLAARRRIIFQILLDLSVDLLLRNR